MSDARAGAHAAFSLTAHPAAYVPSPERERALSQMAAALTAGAVPCLEGPTGIGKTMLLQLLARRVSDRCEALYLPYPMLPTPELCTLAIGLLERSEAGDPERALLRIAGELAARGRPLLILIDDAGSLPADSARGLAALRERAQGSLQIALAGIDGDALRAATAAFGDTLLRVALEEGIRDTEVRDYVAAQLEQAHAPEHLRAAFDDGVLEELARAAAGNPRRLHVAAQTIVRRAEEAPPPVESVPARQPATAPEAPAPSRAASPPDDAGLGEYRLVRRHLVDPQPHVTESAPAVAAAQPARRPPQIDLMATLSQPVPEPAAPKRAAPSVSTAPAAPVVRAAPSVSTAAAAPAVRAAPRAARRRPSLAAVALVAAFSALIGFALASRLPLGLGASEPPPPVPAPAAAPREPVAQSPAPEPIVQAPAAEPIAALPAAEPVARAPEAPPRVPAAPVVKPIEISINATPWAIVEVDGRELGETPLGAVPLSPGPHRFRARFPDGRVLDRNVEIDSAHRTVVFE